MANEPINYLGAIADAGKAYQQIADYSRVNAARQALVDQYGATAGDPAQTQGVLANQQSLAMNPLLVQQQGLVNTGLGLRNQLDQGLIAPTVQAAYGNAGVATAQGQTALSTMPGTIQSTDAANWGKTLAAKLSASSSSAADQANFADAVAAAQASGLSGPDAVTAAANKLGAATQRDPNYYLNAFGQQALNDPNFAANSATLQARANARTGTGPDQASIAASNAAAAAAAANATQTQASLAATSGGATASQQTAGGMVQAFNQVMSTAQSLAQSGAALGSNTTLNNLLARAGGTPMAIAAQAQQIQSFAANLAASQDPNDRALATQLAPIAQGLASNNPQLVVGAANNLLSLGPRVGSYLQAHIAALGGVAATANPANVGAAVDMGRSAAGTGAPIFQQNQATAQPQGGYDSTQALDPYAPQPGGEPVYLNALAGALRKGESGSFDGNYTAISKFPGSDSASAMDKAYGAYQVKGSNIAAWTQKFLGQAMTPAEFLKNPAAQDAVFRGQMSQMIQQYGVAGALRAWYGGPAAANGSRDGATDQNGKTTVSAYANQKLADYGAIMKSFTEGTQAAQQPASQPQGQQPQGQQASASNQAPAVGTVMQGYKFLGGDPSQPSSWQAVQ